MALTTRFFGNSARKLAATVVLTGASILLSAFTASPARAITHHYRHHTTHLTGATHEMSYRHTPYPPPLPRYEPPATIAAYYDDGAGYHMATPYRHHYRHTRYAHYHHS